MELHVEHPIVITPLTQLRLSSYGYFKLARSFAEANYQETIDRISTTEFGKLPENVFIEEYVWAVYVSGFRANTVSKLWPRLMNAYHEAMLHACYYIGDDAPPCDMDRVRRLAMTVFANERKTDAIIKAAGIIHDGIKSLGWPKYRDEHLSTPELLQELPFIGQITRYHLARNIGLLQWVKPDVHLNRMAKHWQYASPQAMCEHLGKVEGLQPGIVDLILWYAASTFGTRDIDTYKETST